jgi:hypothetical protein
MHRAQSICETEYYYEAETTKESIHLRQLKGEIFNEPASGTTTIWVDNQSAIVCSKNALLSEKTKYIDARWHFLKGCVEQGIVKLKYLPTNQVVAEMLTKSLPRPTLTRHRSAILGGADPMQRFIP